MSSATRIGFGRGQHDAELADTHALGVQAEVQIEQDRIGRDLVALDVEVVLGERARLVAELVGELRLLPSLSMRWYRSSRCPPCPLRISALEPMDGR